MYKHCYYRYTSTKSYTLYQLAPLLMTFKGYFNVWIEVSIYKIIAYTALIKLSTKQNVSVNHEFI